MTRRDPDLLDAIVKRHPDEMVLMTAPAGWKLLIESPGAGLHIAAQALTRDELGGLAADWERRRNTALDGPARCTCGELYARHAWDARGKHRGACPSGGGLYEPSPLPADWSA